MDESIKSYFKEFISREDITLHKMQYGIIDGIPFRMEFWTYQTLTAFSLFFPDDFVHQMTDDEFVDLCRTIINQQDLYNFSIDRTKNYHCFNYYIV